MRQLEPSDPRRIGPYALLGRLGAGGMGVVYLGRSAGGRTVAVKLVRPDVAEDPKFRARFRHEVRAARAVSSAFTAPVVDADPDGPLPWLATVFVPSVGLHEAVRLVGAFPEHILRVLAAGIAEELVTIHAAGLTHRDLKPSNVLLALDGPHIIDFGISRAADGTVLTAAGERFGTPSFMSPEHALDRPTGPPSDVFSLGATLVHAASGGHGPFDAGHPLATLRRVAQEEPDLSAVPAGLRLLIAACLAKEPADRPTPQQIIAAVAVGARPPAAGTWLHPVLIAAIEQASAVLAPSATPSVQQPPAPPGTPSDPPTGPTQPLPAPAPTLPLPAPPVEGATLRLTPAPPADDATLRLAPAGPTPTNPTADRPSRRTLLLGLAGGAAALAGGATAVVLGLRGDDPKGPQAAPASTTGAPSPTASARSLATDTVATPLWTAPVTEALVQIIGSGRTVVAMGAGRIWAFDLSGRRLWGPVANRTDLFSGSLRRTLAAVSDTLLFTAGTGDAWGTSRGLRVFDLATGQQAWAVSQPPGTLTDIWVPGILNGIVYVAVGTMSLPAGLPSGPLTPELAGMGAGIWAVDPSTQKTVWTKRFDSSGWQGGTLMVPSSGTRLLWATANPDQSAASISGLDTTAEGKTLWELPAPGVSAGAGMTSPFTNAPWYDGPHSSAGGRFLYRSDRLYAVEPDSGQVAWRSPGDALAYQTTVASPDGTTVYAAGSSFENLRAEAVVRALDAATGEPRWTGRLPLESIAAAVALHCADGNVYLWLKTKVYALDAATGAPRWTYQFGGKADGTGPIAFWAGGGMLFGNTDQGLVAIAADGKAARA
ncbi:PQQ-binding-like beta-propeller repeat protein [Kitasatospora sp. NPDC093550]|uniref:protein kinase domain-containing protein n=1 Tax=Kitasatospora sp. NPDC093550 TaxID=3364089 RepID=UPI003823D82F